MDPSEPTLDRPADHTTDITLARADTFEAAAIDVNARVSLSALPAEDPYVGKTFDGRYTIERSIGFGGMGVVYAARHTVIDKRVAVKVLRQDMARDKEMSDRFMQEARAASSVGSPHIVDISDFGVLPDGATYFVMELLEGKSLTDLNEAAVKSPLPIARVVRIAKQIAVGLGAAHRAGVVHRDMKPDNVMLVDRGTDKDFVKILDFGIAKVGGATSRLTRAGSVFGTPHYMSPEQAAGGQVDARTDIYALGILIYEMLAGRVPFDAENFMAILTQHMYSPPTPLRELEPRCAIEVPIGLDAIVLKCLAKRIEARYASMDDVVRELEAFERGVEPSALPEFIAEAETFAAPANYFGRRTQTSKYLIALVAASLVLIGAAFVARNQGTNASKGANAAQLAPATPAPKAEADPPSAATSTLTAPMASTHVRVTITPSDATVTRDGVAITGGSPYAIDLVPGSHATLAIARSGFRAKTIDIDGSDPAPSVRLDPASGRSTPHAAPAAPAAKPNAKPASPSSPVRDFQDPWAH